MIQPELPINYGGSKLKTCIFDRMELPKDDKWIYELKNKREKNQWVFDLIDKYGK